MGGKHDWQRGKPLTAEEDCQRRSRGEQLWLTKPSPKLFRPSCPGPLLLKALQLSTHPTTSNTPPLEQQVFLTGPASALSHTHILLSTKSFSSKKAQVSCLQNLA